MRRQSQQNEYLHLALLCFILLLGLTMPCRGQNNSAHVSRVTLPDGVRLLLRPEPVGERVAVSLFIRTEEDASVSSAAVAEMVARTLFYGNANRTQNGILTLANEAGGSLDVLRTPDYVVINYVTVSRQLPEAAHLMCDCLKSAEFAPESLRRAFELAHEERVRHQEDPFWRGYGAVCEALGRREPEEAALGRVTQAQAQAYFRARYVPTKTVISIAGRFDSRQVTGLFGAFLTDYARPNVRHTAGARESLPDLTASMNVTDVPAPRTLFAPTRAAYALVGTEAPAANNADYPAFVVLQTLLGGGHASRLFRQARDFGGVGYQVGTLYQAEQKGPLAAYLQWSPQRTVSGANGPAPTSPGSVQKALQAQLDALLAGPPAEAETVRARNFAIGRDALRHELVRDRAFFPGWYETIGCGYWYDAEFPRMLAAVTPADIRRVAKTYLSIRAVVLVLPQTQ